MRISRYDNYVAEEQIVEENIYEKEFYAEENMADYIKENNEEELRDWLIRE